MCAFYINVYDVYMPIGNVIHKHTHAYTLKKKHKGHNHIINVLSIALNFIYRQRNFRKSLDDILSSTFSTAVSI